MQEFLYNISIWLYAGVIFLLSPFHSKASVFRKSRKKNTFRAIPPKDQKKRIWFHVSSLGEFEQARPIMEKLYPKQEIILTFFSPSGFEVRKNYDHADYVTYLPLDFKSNAKEFVNHIQPDIAIIVKYEFWLNHLRQAFEKDIPVIYVSAIFTSSQVYFNRGKKLYIPIFEQVNHFFAQNETSRKLLKEHGINQVSVSGDTRFDRVYEIASGAKKLDKIEGFLAGNECIVFGSTWKSDIDIIKNFIEEIAGKFKVIIAPHNIGEKHIVELEESFRNSQRYSLYNTDEKCDILIIDNIGMLSSLYKYGKYAFIGGGFRGALHNTLEAAVYNIPIFFGAHKNNKKFNEAIELRILGGALAFEKEQELKSWFDKLENDEVSYKAAANACGKYVKENTGATEEIYQYLKDNFL